MKTEKWELKCVEGKKGLIFKAKYQTIKYVL